MGMLQLAGAVSGFGKGMGQGLQTMQNTMSQAMLMEERNKFELARMRETFGHERGLLHERQVFDEKQADTAHSRNLDRMEQEQDFQAGQNRITRESARQKEGRDEERTIAAEGRQAQQRISELVVKEGLSRDAATQKVREEMAKEERDDKRHLRDKRMDATEKAKERQENTGKDIVIETLRGQHRGASGSTKEDYHGQDSKVKAIESTLKMRLAELDSISLTPEREAKIRKEVVALEKERNALLGIKGGYTERPPIRMPQ